MYVNSESFKESQVWEWIVAEESLQSLSWEPHLAPSGKNGSALSSSSWTSVPSQKSESLCFVAAWGQLGAPYSQQLNFIKRQANYIGELVKIVQH